MSLLRVLFPRGCILGTRDLYRKRVGNNTELFAAVRSVAVLWMAFTLVSSVSSVSQVDRQLALLEEVIEPSELSARWGKARSKVGVVVALGSTSKASAS